MDKAKMHLKGNKDIGVTNYDVDFLEMLVYEWVRRSMYSKNFRLSNAIIKSTAHRFKAILKLKSFFATKEWLQKFNLTYLKDVVVSDIRYNCSKSLLAVDIFNELLPKWESLDPKLATTQTTTLVPIGVGGIVSNSSPSENKETIDKDGGLDVQIIDFNNEQKEYINVQNFSPRKDKTIAMYKTTSTYEINFNTNEANNTEFFDIEDELPVCTIFGRKTVENVANLISSNKKSDEDRFEPMIVCTDPKNPNLNAMEKSRKEHTFLNSTNIPEVEKIKDLINGKFIDTDSNTSSQNEYINQYLKEIVCVPENEAADTGPSKQSLLQPTPETEKYEIPIFKPISISKLKIKKTKPDHLKKIKQSSDISPEVKAIDAVPLDSKNQPLTKPNRKRKIKQNLTELPKTINLEKTSVDETQKIKQVELNPTPMPVESLKSLQENDLNQMPTVVQQSWEPAFPQNITASNLPGGTISNIQPSPVAPGGIMYTIQMSAPNQNQLITPYIPQITTNQFGQPTSIAPIVLHFHSPLTLQTTAMLPGSEMSTTVMNLTQTPSISQTSFVPSIDLTQQTMSTNSSNFVKNQFLPLTATTTHAQQSLSTEKPKIVTTPTMSTPSMQQSTIIAPNPTLMTTSTAHVPNVKTTKIKPTKTKRNQATKSRTTTSTSTSLTSNSTLTTPTQCLPSSTKIIPIPTTLLQPLVSSKTPTITSSTLSSSLTKTTPTACLPNFLSTKIITTTSTLIQPTKTPTIASSTLNSSLTSTTSTSTECLQNFVATKIIPTTTTRLQSLLPKKTPTITSTPLTSTPIQKIPIPNTNSTLNTKADQSVQVTITKKSRLTTGPSTNNGTRFAQRAPLKTQEEVVKCIKLMEDFAMMNENFRLIGFLERLERQMYK